MSYFPKVTVIVLNYNGLRHLKDCFSSLTSLDYPSDRLELMLVDNASKDGSVEYMQANYPQVRLVRNEDNLGFATGNNRGAREATGDYIIFLNNDMWVDPQFVRGLIQAVESEPEVVSAGAKILNWDGTRIDFAGAICSFAGHAAQVGFGQPYDPQEYNEIKPMLFACGGAMIIDRQVFLNVGGFDDDYFIYFEDVDLGWRLWLLGYKVVFAPSAITNHRHHGTMKSFSNYRQMVLYKRNALYSMIKNYSDANLGQVLSAAMLATVGGVVEQAVASGQLDKDAYHIKSTKGLDDSPILLDKLNVSALVAMQDVVEHLPQMMAKRSIIQQQRQHSDEEIAHLFRPLFPLPPQITAQTSYTVVDAFKVQQLFADNPRRVLVFSPDLLPYPGLPTVDSGLRAWGIGQGLLSCGHEVVFSMPRPSLKKFEKLVSAQTLQLAWEPYGMVDVVNTVQPDIVVVCSWEIMKDLHQHPMGRMPVILDLQGSHMLEREYHKGDSDSNAKDISAFQQADFLTCAEEKQLVYFQSWLQQAGWTEQEQRDRSAAIPISLSPVPKHCPQDELTKERLTKDLTINSLDKFVRYPSMRSRPLLHPPVIQQTPLQSFPVQLQQIKSLKSLWSKVKFHYRQGGFRHLAYKSAFYLRKRLVTR
ncbi:glycosyltransferase family 2 protein [Tolypothrix sp. VBCCA 56010]|uniref:glycosyltransferase family 2 protein n=1 Tax=Tolypothrix sp. VBCCA 56010 TaxID=3137731 RepID=UPI003D7DB1FF